MTSDRRHLPSTSGLHAQLLVLGAISMLTMSLHLLTPAPAKARATMAPVQVGTSFSPRRAEWLGLDYKQAFSELVGMHFKVIRVSAYWDQIDRDGYQQLDWLMAEAAHANQPVVLSVGMKSLGWPEFYIPPQLIPKAREGTDVSSDPGLRMATLAFIGDTVLRYRDNRSLVAWQVENEPFNRSGPQRWWIGPAFLADEIAVVRGLDTRPMIVNVFSHFNMQFDRTSSRQGFDLRSLLGFDGDSAERDTLSVLQPGDVMGLDVYTRIGYRLLGHEGVSTADSDWDEHVTQWRDRALAQSKQTWVTESQAEPWEADPGSNAAPRSFGPGDLLATFRGLKDAGAQTVLLWGSEYWLWRAREEDDRWIQSVRSILTAEARAPALS